MRIAMLVDSHHPIRDGVVEAIDILWNGLRERGHDVLLIAPDPGKEQRMDGVHYIPSKKFRNFDYYLPVIPSDSIFELKEFNADVINVHGFAFMAVRGVASAKILGKPAVVTFHTPVWNMLRDYSPIDPELAENVGWTYFRNVFKRADATVAQTRSVANELTENGVKANIRVIPTGVNTETFKPDIDGSTIRSRYGLDERKVIIHVGRLCPEKRIDILIEAFAELDENIVLLVVGKGTLEETLKEMAERKGLNERVIFTGFVSDEELPLFYAAADAAASSSGYEAQCLTILNAMACGLPVACPNARAFVDYIEDGVNGYMYDATPKGCAEAIMKCLSSDPSVGMNARRTAEEFSIPRSIDAYLSLYEEVIEAKRRA